MTGPVSGEPVRGGVATHAGRRDGVSGILVLLALGLTFRVIIAYLLPRSGFANDIGAFQYWASNLATQGLNGFYSRSFFHDYTPGYLYVLWVVGLVGQAFGGVGDLIKIPPILGDVALAYLVWSMTLELGGGRWAARLAALIVLVNPITWLDSAIWGQVDSFGVVFLLLAVRELWRDRPERSAVLTVVAALIKPQLGILIPIVAAVTIRRALRPVGAYVDDGPPARRATTTDWEARTRGSIRIFTTGAAGILTAVAMALPFGMSFSDLIQQVFKTAGGYPFLTVNAWNPWALVTHNGAGVAKNSLWVCDSLVRATGPTHIQVGPWVIWDSPASSLSCLDPVSIGALPAVVVGSLLLLAALALVMVMVARRPDRLTILVGLSVLSIAFFVLPTRVHERYIYPFVALGAILAAASPRWTIAYAVSSVATLANMYFVLTTLYPNNPGIEDWLGIGKTLGTYGYVAAAALIQAAALVFAFSELRRAATHRLSRELAGGMRPAADESGYVAVPTGAVPTGAAAMGAAASALEPLMPPAEPSLPAWAAASSLVGARTGRPVPEPDALPGPRTPSTADPAWAATRPSWDSRPSSLDLGFIGWFRHRLDERAIRRDRSKALHGEPGGRVDRLDIWIMAVLAVVLLTGRIWRLAEPYQMHFDEVYHPRTAIEFLQDWRYGISQYIYEWTHPHMAKYAMAEGIIAWGNDRTTATSDLGVPVKAAVIEPRWDEKTTATRVAGDRLWIATGTSVRAYDLATRALVIDFPVPGAQALAIDQIGHRVLIGTTDGSISSFDTQQLDLARWNHTSTADLGAHAFTKTDGAVEFLHVTPDGGTIVAVEPAAAGSTRGADVAIVIDAASASEVGRASLGKVAQVADAGTGTVAFATPDGVPFIDTTTATVTTTIRTSGPAMGIAFTTQLDKDRVYVSVDAQDGPHITTITAPGTGGTPQLDANFRLPGTTEGWVGFDLATQMVHALGTRPETGEPTVYVIEPHSNAVYADAALPAAPAAIVLDQNQRYPSSDREQLLALGAEGAAASVDIGHHAFAWRLPGVFAGVAMAVLLYLLARLLFRRREVAVFLGILIAADGMLFAQSRIGMNDAYVGLGIVAAYVLFTALWQMRGRTRRHWLAFWLGMPAVGGFLGFALASKWVAAYTIGALGILVLARSALGRLLLIGGLVLATTALGYLALSVPPGQTGGNYLFMALMIGLTLASVAANVLHPIAWTGEEERLLVRGPAALGVVVFGLGILGNVMDRTIVVGPFGVTIPQLAFALVALSAVTYTLVEVIGRRGFGPRAVPPADDDPARFLPAPAEAPDGWLRPGVFAGLPMIWALVSLTVIPLALYIVSYIPWANVEGHRLWPDVFVFGKQIATTWPPGHDKQTLWELTQEMYRYHNTLSSPHPASSPWWAWAFDFKPVWFYQESFAGGTSAAIYDAGNLVAWWLAIPAMAFVAWQSFVRRSPALALIAIGFAFQWLAWSRIDRAAFQYHYYTSLPFVLLALAYLLAELWHGASKRTWLLVRLAGAAAILAPTTLWLFHRPLCGFVRVTDVNPGSQACPTTIPDFVLSSRAGAIALVVGVGVLILVRLLLSLADENATDGRTTMDKLRNAGIAAIGVSIAFVAASAFFTDEPLISNHHIPVEPIALIVTLALLPLAAFVATARDARRFVAGVLVAIVGWFIVWYPNIAALPLPQALSNAYQGLLPTYVYPFQFPVSTIDRTIAGPSLFALQPALLLLALAGVSLIIGYAAWVWRIALAEQDWLAANPEPALPDGTAPGTG